jgi:hypothetical protein
MSTEAARAMSRKTAFEEVQKRMAVRSSLLEWCRLVEPQGREPALHHKIIIEHLEKVARGEIQKLMLFLPPGSGKSWFASCCFPPWFMAQRGKSILACSNTMEQSERWGRRIRGLLMEQAPVLGAGLSSESQAAGRFQLDNGAEYLAAGVGSAIVGFRASGGVIIDDPCQRR